MTCDSRHGWADGAPARTQSAIFEVVGVEAELVPARAPRSHGYFVTASSAARVRLSPTLLPWASSTSARCGSGSGSSGGTSKPPGSRPRTLLSARSPLWPQWWVADVVRQARQRRRPGPDRSPAGWPSPADLGDPRANGSVGCGGSARAAPPPGSCRRAGAARRAVQHPGAVTREIGAVLGGGSGSVAAFGRFGHPLVPGRPRHSWPVDSSSRGTVCQQRPSVFARNLTGHVPAALHLTLARASHVCSRPARHPGGRHLLAPSVAAEPSFRLPLTTSPTTQACSTTAAERRAEGRRQALQRPPRAAVVVYVDSFAPQARWDGRRTSAPSAT